MNITEQSIEHLKALLFIAEELREAGIAVLQHSYHPMAFGSFILEVGKPHSKVLFEWDGKESILSISFARLTNQNENPEWVHDAKISLPDGEGIYQEIASNAEELISDNR